MCLKINKYLVHRVVVVMIVFVTFIRVLFNFSVRPQVDLQNKVAMEGFATGVTREHNLEQGLRRLGDQEFGRLKFRKSGCQEILIQGFSS